MRVRPGRHEDTKTLSALAIQVWLHTYATEGVSSVIASYVLSEFTPERFAALLSESSSGVFVAEHGKHLLGYAVVRASAACPISSVSLAQSSRRSTFRSRSLAKVLAPYFSNTLSFGRRSECERPFG